MKKSLFLFICLSFFNGSLIIANKTEDCHKVGYLRVICGAMCSGKSARIVARGTAWAAGRAGAQEGRFRCLGPQRRYRNGERPRVFEPQASSSGRNSATGKRWPCKPNASGKCPAFSGGKLRFVPSDRARGCSRRQFG